VRSIDAQHHPVLLAVRLSTRPQDKTDENEMKRFLPEAILSHPPEGGVEHIQGMSRARLPMMRLKAFSRFSEGF
jgi:hypothetical protein